MKKFTRIIGAVCMMGLLTFVSTSCKKDKENGEMVITVSIPGIETDGDRAYIDIYGLFWWHENDFIRVYNLADEYNAVESVTSVYSKIGSTSTQIARFRGPSVGPKKAEGFRYFYPVNMVEYADENLYNENRQTFAVSPYQQYHSYEIPNVHHYSLVDPTAMPMAARLDKLSDNATLRHLFGVATFSLHAAAGTTVVVDSIKLVDNFFNLSGNVSLKLHKFYLNDSQGAEYSLSYAWEQFMNYQGITPEFLENVLYPWYEFLGYEVDGNTVGHQITLDCNFEQDGEMKGVTLSEIPTGTYFNFMLRPMALSEGFNLTVYIHDAEPIVLTQDDFEYGIGACDYTWATKPGKRKTYIKSFPLNDGF